MEELLRIILKWLKTIIVVVGIAAVGSAIISLLLPAYFTSSTLFQVSNPHMMDRGALFSEELKNPVYLFGGKGDTDRILTLAESRTLYNSVVEKFDLYNHYEVDQEDPQKAYWVAQALSDHYKILKTAEGMMQVEVIDKDPELAANMANFITKSLDTLNKRIITEKKVGLSELYEKEIAENKAKVEQLSDSLKRTVLANPDDTITVTLLSQMAEAAIEQFDKISTIAKEHNSALNQDYSTLYIIEEAVPAVKRSSPVRWLIVVSATLLTTILMIFIVVFVEKFKEWR